MFTGLIEEVGHIQQIEKSDAGMRLSIKASRILSDLALGDSIAIDGVCTTVVDFSGQYFSIEASPETLSKTIFGRYQPSQAVNLERPLTPSSRIGGHYVTGHVDGLAMVQERYTEGNSIIFRFQCQTPDLAKLLVSKGSVSVLGISLTVNTVEQDCFTVAIIPHTLAHTNLDQYHPGDWVNIETDLLGKYVQRLLSSGSTQQRTSSTQTTMHTGAWFNMEDHTSVGREALECP